MPGWWRELVTIPNAGVPERLACKICAIFKVPQVRCEALKDPGDYTVPPSPKCVQRKMFLLVTNSCLPCQDYCLKQLWSTLAYAQALQYCAEKANPLVPDEPCCLVMCVHEMRLMKLYTTFSDSDVFEGLTCKIPEVEVKGAMQPNSIKPLPADIPATLVITPSAPEDGSAALITTPTIPTEELVTPVNTPTVMADELADPPPFLVMRGV